MLGTCEQTWLRSTVLGEDFSCVFLQPSLVLRFLSQIMDQPSSSQDVMAPEERQINMADHPSGIIPTLQNVVATVNMGCKLDLKTIALHARNAEYNPKVSGAISCTLHKALVGVTIFNF